MCVYVLVRDAERRKTEANKVMYIFSAGKHLAIDTDTTCKIIILARFLELLTPHGMDDISPYFFLLPALGVQCAVPRGHSPRPHTGSEGRLH